MKFKYENKKKENVQSVLEAISRKDKFSETKKGIDLTALAQSLAQRRLENEKGINN